MAAGATSMTSTGLCAGNGGGQLLLPSLTAFSISGSINVNWWAYGSGSFLDLHALTTIAGDAPYQTLTVVASGGAKVDLSGLAEVTGPAGGGSAPSLSVEATGAGSIVDLSSLPMWPVGAAGNEGRLLVLGGGEIRLSPALTSLNGSYLILNDGALPAHQFTSLSNGEITVSGGIDGNSWSLGGVTSFANSSLHVSSSSPDMAGQLSFPSLTTVHCSSNGVALRWAADKVGSFLDMHALTTITGDGSGWQVVRAAEGGTVDLSGLTTATGTTVYFESQEGSSVLDLSALRALGDSSHGNSRFLVGYGGGEIRLGAELTSLDRVDLILGNGTMPTHHFTSFRNGTICGFQATTWSFNGMTSMSDANLSAGDGPTAGHLLFPALTTFGLSNGEAAATWRAEQGSLLSLPGLTTIAGDGSGRLSITATDGGTVCLSGLTVVSGTTIAISATGSGSIVDLPSLSALAGGSHGNSSITAAAGTIHLNSVSMVQLDHTTVRVESSGTITGVGLDLQAGSLLTGVGTLAMDVMNTAGIANPSYAAGSSCLLTIDGDYTQGGSALLEIDLYGTDPTLYDRLHVSGLATLAGTLDVRLADGFALSAGDAFDILDWVERHGTFDQLLLPELDGSGVWDVDELYTTGELAVVSAIPGDANKDGAVDADDATILAINWGLHGDWAKGDFNGDRVVGAADAAILAANWGRGIVEQGGDQTVPEPACNILLLSLSLLFLRRR